MSRCFAVLDNVTPDPEFDAMFSDTSSEDREVLRRQVFELIL